MRQCLFGPAATYKQKHRAALVDLQHLAVGAQSDFANWRCASGMQNRQVVEPVGAARIYGEEPKRLRMVIVSVTPVRSLTRCAEPIRPGFIPPEIFVGYGNKMRLRSFTLV